MENIHHKFSGHLCATCGGPAPDWKCPGCGKMSATFDPRHFVQCPAGAKMQAKCYACGQAESKCVCV